MSNAPHILEQPWYVLLASGNSSFLVLGVIVLTSFSFSVGSAVKDVTGSIVCAIYRDDSTSCLGIEEAFTQLLLVLLLTLATAQTIVSLLCSILKTCNNDNNGASRSGERSVL